MTRVFDLGHVGRAGVPFDLDEVLTAAKERHKLIEINEHSLGDMPERSSVAGKLLSAVQNWVSKLLSQVMRI